MRAAAVHEDNICCSEWDFSAGRKKYHQGAPRAVGVWEIQDRERGAWELGCGRYGEPACPEGGCSEGPGARGIMIHSTQRIGGGRFSRRTHGDLVEQRECGVVVGTGERSVAAGGARPRRVQGAHRSVCPHASARGGGLMCDIDDTLIEVSWGGTAGSPDPNDA